MFEILLVFAAILVILVSLSTLGKTINQKVDAPQHRLSKNYQKREAKLHAKKPAFYTLPPTGNGIARVRKGKRTKFYFAEGLTAHYTWIPFKEAEALILKAHGRKLEQD